RIAGRVGLEGRAVGEGAVDVRPLDHDVSNAILINLAEQLGERDVLRGRALTGVLEEREQRQQQQDNDDPEGEVAQIGVHDLPSWSRGSRPLSLAVALFWQRGENPRSTAAPNLGVARVNAKGTPRDYLTHLNPIPVQKMAQYPGFLPGG